MVRDIKIEDYTYDLPEERIAKFPLLNRDDSKLLVCTSGTDFIPIESKFRSIADYLPGDGFMVFNDARVVPARMIFRRDSGALIEIFCLEPDDPGDYQLNFASTSTCRWKAIVGNAKKWKGDVLSLYTADGEAAGGMVHCEGEVASIQLKARLIRRDGNTGIVEFSWSGGLSFSKVMECCGRIPIPPYLKRDTQPIDYERYQTYYARQDGSVAAPTAGLHFTEKELRLIDEKGIRRAYLCLHVGAGTFLPVKSEHIGDHRMHSEPFTVALDFVLSLLEAIKGGRPVIAVGTTSTRCLESLYYLGIHCLEKGEPSDVDQWEPYRSEGYAPTVVESLSALADYMKSAQLGALTSRTSIIIAPGFKYRVVRCLVTNFHQPQSTLLLLIAALVGERWHDIYNFALDHGFRFLSYGDSSLLELNDVL